MNPNNLESDDENGIDVTAEMGGYTKILERLFNDPREPDEIIACGDMRKWQIEFGLIDEQVNRLQ